MPYNSLSLAQLLKISCFSQGIKITPDAKAQLTQGGKVPISIHEYATTGGVSFIIDQNIFVNAPFDEWFCVNPEAILDFNPDLFCYEVRFRGEVFETQVLPLPGYLEMRDMQGRLVRETIMSHADRIRVSPIYGCAFGCKFCDLAGQKYIKHSVDQLLEGLFIAREDKLLPTKHVLISGGTPGPRDYAYFDNICNAILQNSNTPVDVMMAPRHDDIFNRLGKWGVSSYAINLEIYDQEVAKHFIPQKHRLGISLFTNAIESALQNTGGEGRVRSLLVVGLESSEKTLEGVEFLAKLGCDPVLSPFRPAQGTPMHNVPTPSAASLERVYLESLDIVERYGVKLGPRCIPCQHNTLTFPDGTNAYYYS